MKIAVIVLWGLTFAAFLMLFVCFSDSLFNLFTDFLQRVFYKFTVF